MEIAARFSKLGTIRSGFLAAATMFSFCGFPPPAQAITIATEVGTVATPEGIIRLTETLTSCSTTCGYGADVDTFSLNGPAGLYITGFAVGIPSANEVISYPNGWTAMLGSYTFYPLSGQEVELSYVSMDTDPAADQSLGVGLDLAAAGSVATSGAGSPFAIFYMDASTGTLCGMGPCHNTHVDAYGVTSATPLPSTWLMLLSSFVGLGFLVYRGSKKNAAALVA